MRGILVGRWESLDAKKSYDRLLVLWVQAGWKPFDPEPARTPGIDNALPTVADLSAAFQNWAAGYYVKGGRQTDEVCTLRSVVGTLVAAFGDLRAADFGAEHLAEAQGRFVADGLSRKICNRCTAHVAFTFRWAAAPQRRMEWRVPSHQPADLPLRRGP